MKVNKRDKKLLINQITLFGEIKNCRYYDTYWTQVHSIIFKIWFYVYL